MRRYGNVEQHLRLREIVVSVSGTPQSGKYPRKASMNFARMAAGDVTDLAAVRAYIDAARAPWS